jgi:hypothetical protein
MKQGEARPGTTATHPLRWRRVAGRTGVGSARVMMSREKRGGKGRAVDRGGPVQQRATVMEPAGRPAGSIQAHLLLLDSATLSTADSLPSSPRPRLRESRERSSQPLLPPITTRPPRARRAVGSSPSAYYPAPACFSVPVRLADPHAPRQAGVSYGFCRHMTRCT